MFFLTSCCFVDVAFPVTEFMFVHSDGGKRGASWAHPLWSHHVWDHHRRSRCKDTQDTTSRGHHGGEPHAVFTLFQDLHIFNFTAAQFDSICTNSFFKFLYVNLCYFYYLKKMWNLSLHRMCHVTSSLSYTGSNKAAHHLECSLTWTIQLWPCGYIWWQWNML